MLIPRAEVVNSSRDNLFPRSRFAQNQNGDVGSGDGFHVFQDALESDAIADDLFKVGLGVELFFQIPFLKLAAPQGFLGFSLFGKIPDDAQHYAPLRGFDRPKHDVRREFASVLAPAEEVEPRAHRTRAGRYCIFLGAVRMRVTKTLRDEGVDRLSD